MRIYPLLLIALSTIIVILIFFLFKLCRDNLKYKEERDVYKEQSLDTEKNVILSKILSLSMGRMELQKSLKMIADVYKKYFCIDYCTIFLSNKRKYFNISTTNIHDDYSQKELEKFVNQEILRFNESSDEAGIAYTSPSSTLKFNFAQERGIKYFLLLPLIVNKEFIGAIVVENRNTDLSECFEEDFFNLVIDNTALAIQKFIYDDMISSRAMKDGLTGVYNRAYINNRLKKEIQKHSLKNEKFTLAILDVDYFKKFNDTYGHLFGDEVLKQISALFKQNIREGIDFVGRYGGEEFILFFDRADNSKMYNKLENLREILSKMPINLKIEGEERSVNVTASFGIAEYPSNGSSVQELIESADKALYYSKENGRDRVTVYSHIKKN